MSRTSRPLVYPLICLFGLASCGGGGGGGSPPPPAGDTSPPDTTIVSSPAARTNHPLSIFEVGSPEVGVTFELSLDGGPFTPSPSFFAFDNLPEGDHVLRVRARDAAGNADATPATYQWTIDRTGPDTTVTSTTGATSNSASATFALAASEAGATFEASLDGAAYSVVTTPWTLSGLVDGAHSISVRAIDNVTNVDPTPAIFAWQIDTTPPTARVVFPSSASYTDAAQLHIRGTAQDTGTVTSVRVNGVAATSSDGFAHWSAVVPVSIGNNPFVVSVTDGANNTNPSAATITVTNRGVVVNEIKTLAFDSAGGRLIFTDPERRALLASRVSDRYVSVISDASRGSGPVFQQPAGVALDGARALVTDTSTDTLVAVDLATGNRTQLSGPVTQNEMRVAAPLAYHPASQTAFVGTLSGTILAIDLANGGARSVRSGGGIGTGIAFDGIRGMALDNSTGTTRLLVADGGAHAIIAVNLSTGDRSIISYAAPLDPNNQIGSGPAVYSLGQLSVDEAGHRVFVPDLSPSAFVGRLFSIDLVTGNRTVLTSSTPDVELHFPDSVAFDPVAAQVYFGMAERGRVFRYDLASAQVRPFVDSTVGIGYVLNYPYGVLLDTVAGFPALYSLTRYPAATSYRIDVSNGERFTIINHIGAGGLPTLGESSNFVLDTRDGATGKALFLDTPYNEPVMRLYGLDLVTGALSVIASAPFPEWQFMSRMALDTQRNRVVVGLRKPGGGSGSVVAMDLSTGALSTIASLSVGNGPPMYEIGAVAAVPGTFGTTANVFVGVDYQLLAVNSQGDRNFISADSSIGSGPPMVRIEDMEVDIPGRRALVVSGQSQAMQWVDLDTGNRTLVSGLNASTQSVRGSGPPIFGHPIRVATDLSANIAYVTVMQTIILAVDLESGDRVILSR